MDASDRFQIQVQYDFLKRGWVSWLVDLAGEWNTLLVWFYPSTLAGEDSVLAQNVCRDEAEKLRKHFASRS
jgi:hypothetical protein